MGHKEHHESAKSPVAVLVVTVSDTRTHETDTSGGLIVERLAGAGHLVVGHEVVRDDAGEIARVFEGRPPGTQAVIFNGGTGISRRDTTFDAVERLLDKTLPGFGEIFRRLSYDEIGAAAMMSRAVAGVAQGVAVFSVPGSTGAVRLAMDRLILGELPHFVWEIGR